MTNIDSRIAKRITYARLLLRNANGLFNRNDAVSGGLALLCAQDAIEMLLRAIAEHYSLLAAKNFDDIIASIDRHFASQSNPIEVPRKTALQSLNRARVEFKHRGNLADIADAEDHLMQAQLACAEASLIFLGASLDSFSLSNLILSDQVRNHIKKAEQHYTLEEYQGVFDEISSAFARTFGHAGSERRGRAEHKRAMSLREIQSFDLSTGDNYSKEVSSAFRTVEREFDSVYNAMNKMEKQLELYSLGVSTKKLHRLHQLLPLSTLLASGRVTGPTLTWQLGSESAREDARFAIEFTTDCVLLADKNGLMVVGS